MRGNPKLTPEQVTEIRKVIEYRDSMRKKLAKINNANLAKHYGVHKNTIDRIRTGERCSTLP